MSKTKNSKTTSPGRRKYRKKAPDKGDMSQEELVLTYKRIKTLLTSRLSKAKKRDDEDKDSDSASKLEEASRDLYAYMRLLEVCESLSKDVSNLKDLVDVINESSITFMLPDVAKKGKMN